jgi:hypothetical protein
MAITPSGTAYPLFKLFPSTAPIADQIALTFTALEEQAVTFTGT